MTSEFIPGKLYRAINRIGFYKNPIDAFSASGDMVLEGAVLMFLGQELTLDKTLMSFCFLVGDQVVYTESQLLGESHLLKMLEGPL